MLVRTSNAQTTHRMLSNMQNAQQALVDIQGKVSSNKRISIASDDPLGSISSLANRSELRRSEQLDKNAGRATEWLNAADRAAGSAVDILTEIRSLVIQANSGSLDATARTGIADRISQLRDDLIGVANTTVGNRAIFAGAASGAAYATSGGYQGDSGSMSLSIAPGVTMQVSRTGPEVFGVSNPSDPANGDVFEMLSNAVGAVTGGNASQIASVMSGIDTATTRVQNYQTEMGSKLTRVENLAQTAALRRTDLSSQISQIEDVDLAEAIVTMKSREVAYQGALNVAAQVMQLSLLNFLK